MRGYLLAGIAVVLLTPAGSRAAGRARSDAARCSGSSPKAVVRSYYAAINNHQAAAAKACLTPYFRAQSTAVVDPDWVNIMHVRGLILHSHTSHPVPSGMLPGNVPHKDMKPYAAAEVTAQFMVHYYHVIDSPNGRTIRFIYAVKQEKRSPWRIAAIGSGP